jgi:transaldolase
MHKNPVQQAHDLGQSIWLDDLSRELIQTNRLQKLMDQGLRGITSNPKILDAAISEGSEYEDEIHRLIRNGKSRGEIYEALAVHDIQAAADLLRPYFRKELDQDGFVSLEVSPHLAYTTRETIEEARRLWRSVDRPNVFIKVPATRAGLPAIQTLTREGVNINVTLLFGLGRYREVAEAYLAGMEERLAAGEPGNTVHSVASFFLSRIDVLVDSQLDKLNEAAGPHAELARKLRGTVAIASAKLASQIFNELFGSSRFRKLAEGGAEPQRLLWGSTSAKDPAYSDVKYVEALIGPDTINTLPQETFEAFLDHGKVEPSLTKNLEGARETLALLPQVGIDLDLVTARLIEEGVKKFIEPFDHLMSTLDKKQQAA